MNKLILTLAIVLIATFSAGMSLFATRPKACITVILKDDLGNIIPKQKVGMYTFSHNIPGPEFGRNINAKFTAITNKDGVATLHGEGIRRRFFCYMARDERYYLTDPVPVVFKEAKAGRWEPWNPTVTVVVCPILNPIPMYHKRVDVKIPKMNNQHGFDLLVGDWVEPIGKGKTTDIFFKISEVVPLTKKKDARGHWHVTYDFRLEVAFPNKGDGIQTWLEKNSDSSWQLTMPRFAPTENYNDKLEVRDFLDEQGNRFSIQRAENLNYFIRVRTVLDKNGKVKSALYGKIPSGIDFQPHKNLRFRYYLNPTPNDTNMEYDQKRNLIPPDKPESRANTRPKTTTR
ncbi:MAG: hypothetical protein LBR07_02155 [Puniceicoccales bacterium]|nr:hypothetical protein [Puniceicoccales bacterium]